MEEEKLHSSSRESTRLICLQVFPVYLLAGLGMVMAGLLLDRVQEKRGKTESPASSITERRHDSSGNQRETSIITESLNTILEGHPLIKMRNELQSPQHQEHYHSGEEKEKMAWREKEDNDWQHRRAEKKLLAFWMSLSHRTWKLLRPRERAGFQRSTSSARLLKSEA
ncbi:hypothetical protein NQZ68_024611 [Dissostichus eleginoides]|nr:hypothetical protein NQZ68_024611 [Dissostichus eleginoides]